MYPLGSNFSEIIFILLVLSPAHESPRFAFSVPLLQFQIALQFALLTSLLLPYLLDFAVGSERYSPSGQKVEKQKSFKVRKVDNRIIEIIESPRPHNSINCNAADNSYLENFHFIGGRSSRLPLILNELL